MAVGWLKRAAAEITGPAPYQLDAPAPAPPAFERRDPRAATQPARSTWSVGSSMPTLYDDVRAVTEAYLANVYVYRCIDAIAKAISGCPVRVGANPTTKSDYNLGAPLAQLLGPPPGSPCPGISPSTLWAWTVAQRLIHGRWCWEVERTGNNNTGRVQAVWPLPASLVAPVASKGGRALFDSYEVATAGGIRKVTLSPQQAVYGWRPSQTDIREAESPMQAARLDISIAVMQGRYDRAFLLNDARPAAIVVHDEFAEADEREAFRRQFNSAHRGPDNAGKAFFVEATPGPADQAKAFEVITLGLSQRDAQFDLRAAEKRDAICVAFGTPLSVLGNASGRTFDNAGQEATNWWEGTLLPLCAEFADTVNQQLAPFVGSDVMWFDTSHVDALRGRSKLLALGGLSVVAMKKAGLVTTNEIRGELGLGPVDGGDVLVEDMSVLPAGVDQQPVDQSGPLPSHEAQADVAATAGLNETDMSRSLDQLLEELRQPIDVATSW